jgi:hypothetical protein
MQLWVHAVIGFEERPAECEERTIAWQYRPGLRDLSPAFAW